MSSQQFDVFICHASEDKAEVVRPLVNELEKAAISYWVDEDVIGWGDSITTKVNEGLSKSKFVLVVFSPAMMQKPWPQRELNAALNQEASTGEVRVLPLLVGSKEERQEIIDANPLLGDKLFQVWTGDSQSVVAALQAKLRKSQVPVIEIDHPKEVQIEAVPLPRKKQAVTQRDKDLFLRATFDAIHDYFEYALRQLELSDSRYSTDMFDVARTKFLATIYVDGDIGNKCKIWIGGLGNTDSILYSENNVDSYQDNSFNAFLEISVTDEVMHLRAFLGSIFGNTEAAGQMDKNQSARHLWARFIERIN